MTLTLVESCMGRLRNAIHRVLDLLDPPPPPPPPLAACPGCGGDVWERNVDLRIDLDLTFVKCVCGCPSAWLVNGHGPQLIYDWEPKESEDE